MRKDVYLSPEDVEKKYGLGKNTINALMRLLPHTRVKGKLIVRQRDFDALFDRCLVERVELSLVPRFVDEQGIAHWIKYGGTPDWARVDRKAAKAPEPERKCNCCGEMKPVSSYGDAKRKMKVCRQCRTTQNRIRRQLKKEKGDLNLRARAVNEAARQRLGVDFVAVYEADIIRLFTESPGCFYCEAANLDEGRGFHIDHRIPLSRGGAHVTENLALACDCCNRAKWDKTEEEFRAWLLRLKGGGDQTPTQFASN